MSELAYYKIGQFEFCFTNYDIDNSIFNIFHIDSALVQKHDEDSESIYLKTNALMARKRFNLKCHISINEIEDLFNKSLEESYRISSYFEDMNFSDEDAEKLLKKEFSFKKYIKALNELFTKTSTEEFQNFLKQNKFRIGFEKEAKHLLGDYTEKSILNSLLLDSFIDCIKPIDGGDDFLLFEKIKSSNQLLKILLLALPDETEIYYELSYVISSGCLELNDIKKKDNSSKVLVITEGKTDYRYLQPMIKYLTPEYEECFTFMPLDGIDQSASYVAKYYKIFKNANLKRNILFVFDNDLAGRESFEKIPKRQDEYLKAIQLPDFPEYKKYPCISLDGTIVDMDINGKAVAIEMMFPDKCLTINGKLSPIRWSNYKDKYKSYQGSLEEKAKVGKQIETFNKNIDLSPNDCGFSRLKSLINKMIDAFAQD